MNASLQDGFGGYLALALVCALAHEPWRWLGFALGRNILVDSELFRWVRAVATALVAGLVAKLLVFPVGTLAAVPWWVRAAALLGALACYQAGRKNLAVGVGSAAGLLVVLEIVRGLW